MSRLAATFLQIGAARWSARAPAGPAFAQPSIEDRLVAILRRVRA